MQHQTKYKDQANDAFAHDDPHRWDAMNMVFNHPLAASPSMVTVQDFPQRSLLPSFLFALLLAAILIIL